MGKSNNVPSQETVMEDSSLLIKKRKQPKTKLFMFIFILTLIAVVANQVLVNINTRQAQAYNRLVSDLSASAQAIARHADSVINGNSDSLAMLDQAESSFQSAWTLLNNGAATYIDTGLGIRTPLPPRGMVIDGYFPDFRQNWEEIATDVNQMLDNQEGLTQLDEDSERLGTLIPVLKKEYDTVEASLQGSNLPLSTVAAAQRQAWLAERIGYNLQMIMSGDIEAGLANTFQQDIELFLQNHQALLEGNRALGITRIGDGAARDSLFNVSAMLSGIQGPAAAIIAGIPDLQTLAAAEDRISVNSTRILEEINQMGSVLSLPTADTRLMSQLGSPIVGYGLLFLLLLSILAYGKQVLKQSQEAEQVSAEKNSRNNEAVMKLLSEISSLGDGDLTVKATVGKDFTGAIADSINYAVQQLRELVSAITSTAMEVTTSTEASRETVESLSAATKRQTDTITSVHDSIREIGNGINQVNENAQKTLDVAKNSVKTAAGGATVVKDTIKGMGNIRDQIQDTSKRIKRLGESSQEIGGFVSLINDIAEHTNTLSLNAAIQAATAGDAGKGFAVVADEVHALAERSADATRQIESLVKVIQNDIKEAVKSMEETTSEVVEGTKLAKSAGVALDDIQRVSKELEELVNSMTAASSNQSKAAIEITRSMDVIQQMTANTTSGVEATTEFMESLGDLTERLRNAVSGFSLEEKGSKWARFDETNARGEASEKDAGISNLKVDSRKEGKPGGGLDEDSMISPPTSALSA